MTQRKAETETESRHRRVYVTSILAAIPVTSIATVIVVTIAIGIQSGSTNSALDVIGSGLLWGVAFFAILGLAFVPVVAMGIATLRINRQERRGGR